MPQQRRRNRMRLLLRQTMTRRPTGGGRPRLFTQQQELAIVNLVRANNAIRLHQLQQQILEDTQVFNNINRVSITTIRRILVKHNMTMKQLYRVQFERNSVGVKGLRHEYVQKPPNVNFIMDLSEVSYDILFHILIHVPFWELNSNCRLVCKRWKDAVDSQSLWREKYKQALSKKLQTRLPSNTDWKNLFYKLFARNLIKNPCGDDGFEYWNVNHGGDGWVIERHHGELKETTSPNCFVTSYRWCKKTQCVDLLKEGFEEHFLDDFQPDILINDWYGSRNDCGAKYKIKVHLLNSQKQLLMSFKKQYPEIPQWNNCSYNKVQRVFRNYGPGVRFVVFSHQGIDNKFWAGHYGARIANSTVKVFPDNC
ncbi:F-box only protein 44-like [Erpetoichthys calabaricus]|uniref:F-box only protein 44-like n=1 Tax=Erpetoichthys calabaricus TaxID=27687 RepID=UPI002234C27D|nr:F-box only protein 44-like [Erpetoichthys calabaricus]